MTFRFTLTHRGSEVEPLGIPPLSQWATQTGADVEWTEGAIPSVTLPGTGPFTPATSEYIYVDFGFEDGVEYSITLQHTTEYNSGSSNPRTVTLAILDNSFAIQFSETDTFPPSPGGTDSISISFTANSTSTKIGFKASSGSNVTIVVNEVSGTGADPSDVTESLQINEPDGWKEAVMKLARDKEFHSLVELFDGSFIFYGNNGVINGGIQFIEFYEITRGLDANIEILIEIAPDDETYETCFEGQLDLSLGERLPKNKYRIPIIRDNFWAKFISRLKTPVDLQAAVDLDGRPIEPVAPVDLTLTDQKVTYFSDYDWLHTMTYPEDFDFDPLAPPDFGPENYLMLSFDDEKSSDIKLFSLVRAITGKDGSKTFGLFEAPWNGDYLIQLRAIWSVYDPGSNEWSAPSNTRLRIRKTGQDSVEIYQFNGGINNGTDNASLIDFEKTYSLQRGEQLSIMLHRVGNVPNTVFGKDQLTWIAAELATTTNITLSGEQTIDGVLTSSSRVLVKNQGNPQENGPYVSAAGAWVRATDMDTADEFNDVAVFVSGGTDQTDTAWRQTEPVNTVGVDAVRFVFTEPSDEWQKPFPEVYDTTQYILDAGPEPAPTSEVFTERTTPGSFIKITATTVYPTTQSPGFLVHDAAAAILKHYGLEEDNPFYSELLGSALTNARIYGADGCAWRYLLLRGLQIRGYTLTDKPFSMSFEQWWKGLDPILCLGLGYDTIGGETINPEDVSIDPVEDWVNAPGGGTWNLITYNLPIISINGSGDDSSYVCGAMTALAGVTYPFTAVLEAFEPSGTLEVTYAILDSGFNEIVTEVFNYTTAGFKVESFNLTPPINGSYFAVKVINNTPIDTKTVALRLAVGSGTTQLLLNEDFNTSAVWTNEDAGTDWTVGSGVATVTISTISKKLTQDFLGGEVGEYLFISEIRTEDVGGGEGVDVTANFYDEDDNLLNTDTQSFSSSTTVPWGLKFTPVVPVTKVEINAEVTAGTDITVTIPYAGLFISVPAETVIIPEERVIRVEEREFFYQEEMSVLISGIEEISRKYDTDKIYNKIEIGYSQWQSEDISGIDDPQTKHTYSDRFQKVGQEIIVLSDFIAASLAIETTRRQTIEKSTDYKFDNNTFIVAINTDDVSPDSYVPELGENFSSVLNLLNSETRYNIRISVARNFLRWRKWFNGCLQSYLSSFFKFVSGEGNFDMVTIMTDVSPDCLGEDNEGQSLSEKQDIEVTDTIVHTPFYYEIEVPMEWETYKTIRNNRRNAIGISLTDSGHVPLFIDQLDYEVMNGTAKITGWTKVYFPLEVIEGPAPTQECLPSAEACENAITNELGEELTDENGLCITFAEEEVGDGIFDDTFDDTFE